MSKPRQHGRALLKIFGILVGLVFVVHGVNENWRLRSLKSTGKVAVVDPITGYTEHRKHGSTTYTAQFTFTTDTGQKVTKGGTFGADTLADFEARRPVKVFYDPADPTDFVFDKEEATWVAVWIGIFIAVTAIVFG